MPSTNQTDLAGREWRTTPAQVAEAREEISCLGVKPEDAARNKMQFLLGVFDDLETALAKIEALEAERDEARGAIPPSLRSKRSEYVSRERFDEVTTEANLLRARVTALEGELTWYAEQAEGCRKTRQYRRPCPMGA